MTAMELDSLGAPRATVTVKISTLTTIIEYLPLRPHLPSTRTMSTVNAPPQALRLLEGAQKVHTYETSGGPITARFAAYNLSLAPTLPPNAVVHDNACGAGTASRILLANGNPQNITIHATDIDAPFLSALSSDAEKNGWPIHVSNQRSEALDFADNFFDLSIMNLAIFFSPNQGLDGAKEIYRILKPGGVGLVNCWEHIPWLIPFQSAYELVRAKKIPTGPLAVWHDGQHLQKVMRDAGFKQEDMKMERHEAWLEVKRQDLREWAEKIWAYMAGVAGWVEGDEEKWDQAVDTLTESLLVQPGTEITDDVVKMKGSQWVVVAKK
ncbi:S-adenosyl-L-methionine-dependent methyltransferase [Coprinopsis sp. MPI-PUGE-AT-0042]|nr:S-adenosyl-L-methionine-dependent methyltransferase [Coprinopsis sp. MPI-PUGE-AT-0042]